MATRAVSQSINLQADQTSKYITRISSDGITVHPEIQNSGSNYIHIDSNGLKIKNQEGSAPAISTDTELAGFTSDSVQIGNETSSNTLITTDGIQIRDGETTLASFTDTLIQIGNETSSNTLITTDGIQIRDGETTLASFTDTLIQIGNETSGNTLITTDGMTVRDGTETLASFTKDMVQIGDPSNGGGNLLARSNGVAIRNGLAKMAAFSENKFLFLDDNGTPIYEITDDYVPETAGGSDPSFATIIRNSANDGMYRSQIYSYRNKSDNGMATILEGREDVTGKAPYTVVGLRAYNSETASNDEIGVLWMYSDGRIVTNRIGNSGTGSFSPFAVTADGSLRVAGNNHYIKYKDFNITWTASSSYTNTEKSVDLTTTTGTPLTAIVTANASPTLAHINLRINGGKLYAHIWQIASGTGNKTFTVRVLFRMPN